MATVLHSRVNERLLRCSSRKQIKVLLLARWEHDQQHQSTADEHIGRVVALINDQLGEELCPEEVDSPETLATRGGKWSTAGKPATQRDAVEPRKRCYSNPILLASRPKSPFPNPAP